MPDPIPLVGTPQATIGVIGLSGEEFRAIVEQVAEEGWSAFMQAYTTTMELLTPPASASDLTQAAAQITPEGMALLMATQPALATDLIRKARNA